MSGYYIVGRFAGFDVHNSAAKELEVHVRQIHVTHPLGCLLTLVLFSWRGSRMPFNDWVLL